MAKLIKYKYTTEIERNSTASFDYQHVHGTVYGYNMKHASSRVRSYLLSHLNTDSVDLGDIYRMSDRINTRGSERHDIPMQRIVRTRKPVKKTAIKKVIKPKTVKTKTSFVSKLHNIFKI